ncbi:YusW family protein [Bacillus sp. FJAT-45037]|uniref:YusW family protein n=1 Tax=Bacillus sp. FJAT-45037 TaxID=2011007 RepID=UPI000C24BA7C|nr:YusW family protein [Bacillus sp. FJAT-45037]
MNRKITISFALVVGLLVGCNVSDESNDTSEVETESSETTDSVITKMEEAIVANQFAIESGNENESSNQSNEAKAVENITNENLEKPEEDLQKEKREEPLNEKDNEEVDALAPGNESFTEDTSATNDQPLNLLQRGVREFELEIEFKDDYKGKLEIEYESKKDKPKAKIKDTRGKGKKNEEKGKEAVAVVEALLSYIYIVDHQISDEDINKLLALIDVNPEHIKEIELEIEFNDDTELEYER